MDSTLSKGEAAVSGKTVVVGAGVLNLGFLSFCGEAACRDMATFLSLVAHTEVVGATLCSGEAPVTLRRDAGRWRWLCRSEPFGRTFRKAFRLTPKEWLRSDLFRTIIL